MKITKIKLTGFKRIALTGYRNIEIDFTNKVQLVLGMNSSGKSSIMYELSPLPIATTNLYPEGGKEIWIEHNHESYYLSNWKDGKCSFIRQSDKEELNPGGTQAVQKEMIKQIFNYDNKIHELLIGKEEFTDMKPNRRKEWITELSDVNYDYALKVFTALKERNRDIQGALKLTKKKLVEALEVKTDSTRVDELKRSIQLAEQRLEALNQLRIPEVETRYSLQQLEDKFSLLKSKTIQLIRLRHSVMYHSPNRVRLSIEVLNNDLATLINKKETISKKIIELTDKLSELERYSGLNKDNLETRKNACLARINEISRRNLPEVVFEDPNAVLNIAISLQHNLVEISSKLPSNEEGYFSNDKLKALQVRLNQAQYERDIKQGLLNNIKLEINHIQEHNKADNVFECPSCKHSFNPFIDSAKLKILESREVELSRSVFEYDKRLGELKSHIAEQEAYLDTFNEFLFIARSSPIMSPFWVYLSENKIVSRYPAKLPSLISMLIDDLKNSVEKDNLNKEITKIDESLERIKWSEGLNLDNLKNQISQYEEDLGISIAKENEIRSRLVQLNNLAANFNKIDTLHRECGELFDMITRTKDGFIRSSYQDHLLQSIRLLQGTIGIHANELNSISNNEAIIRNIENEVTRLEAEEVISKQLMKALSPTEGLIAKGLMGFIEHLVNQMNALINSVWSYSMNIIPPSINEDGSADLDYKFPFKMVSEANKVGDIGLGSKGQREIINLAFRIVACKYLHLQDVPIFADEFGTGLDETHRKRAANVIKNIVMEHSYSQLFMISHYEDAHGSLVNAEVCVLCPDNITVPRDYNEHVAFS